MHRPDHPWRALAGLALASAIGCGSTAAPPPAPTSGSPNYGENKLPPPEKVKAVPGKGARSTGAPPMQPGA